MSTLPRTISRNPNRIELTFRSPSVVTRHRVSGHKSLDGAFAGTVNMFTVDAKTSFRSPTVIKKGWGIIDETFRGLTKVLFDPNDYSPLSINLPTDKHALFLRFEDEVGGAWEPYSSIYIIPPVSKGIPNALIPISGTAPGGLGAVAGEAAPPGAMSFGVHQYAMLSNISNFDGTDNLLVSFQEGMPMIPVAPGSTLFVGGSAVAGVWVASEGVNTVSFAMMFTLSGV